MRTAIASLILVAGLVSAAQAQDQTPAPAATAPAPAAAPAPMAAAPASAATPDATAPAAAPAPMAPMATAPAPDATPPAPVADATPPPSLPTAGDGAVIVNVIDKLCVPLVRGGKIEDLAKPLGMRYNRRDDNWAMPLGPNKTYTITVFPTGSNKDVCRGELHYAAADEKDIVSAFNVWSFLHQPELILQANYVSTNADGLKRVQKSWEHLDSSSSTAINFTTVTKPDDTPVDSHFSTGEFFYQERAVQ